MWRLAWGRVPRVLASGRPFDLRLVAASLDSQYLALLQSFGHFAAGSCAHRRIAFSFRCIHGCLGVRPAFVQWRLPARVQHCWLQFCVANSDLPVHRHDGGLPYSLRLCDGCRAAVGDEQHVLLECPATGHVRLRYSGRLCFPASADLVQFVAQHRVRTLAYFVFDALSVFSGS